jgi:hypothetical protein
VIVQCALCGGRLEVIASIEEPELIERILAHRRERGGGGGADGFARSARAAAGVAIVIRLTGPVRLSASGGRYCARRGRAPRISRADRCQRAAPCA